jgi:hypothetical protein
MWESMFVLNAMSKLSAIPVNRVWTALATFLALSMPVAVFAYSQPYYQAYYQPYYQAYYQAYYQTYYQGSYGAPLTLTGNVRFEQDLIITRSLSKGSGTFVIDHPLDPKNKLLYHSFVESPVALNLYDGVATLDAAGEAVVVLPDYFEALNKDFRYQFFPLDEPMPGLYIKREVAFNQFTIAGGAPGGKVSWQVTGVRHDPYILANPIVPEVEKGPDALLDKGECLHEPLCQ